MFFLANHTPPILLRVFFILEPSINCGRAYAGNNAPQKGKTLSDDVQNKDIQDIVFDGVFQLQSPFLRPFLEYVVFFLNLVGLHPTKVCALLERSFFSMFFLSIFVPSLSDIIIADVTRFVKHYFSKNKKIMLFSFKRYYHLLYFNIKLLVQYLYLNILHDGL